MATGRIGVSPVLRLRWSKLPTAGTTSLSGLDDNSVALVYDAGYEAVYRNGVLLSRGNDYTATNGTTITLIDATIAGDVVEVLANDLIPLTDAISKGQYNAKAALLSATAASTPAVLTVGANGTILTANSATATGLEWAAPAGGGGMTSIASGSLSGAEVSITSIPGTYVNLFLVIDGYSLGGGALALRYNSISTSTYSNAGVRYTDIDAAAFWNERAQTIWYLSDGNPDAASTTNGASVLFPMYAGSSVKQVATLSNYVSSGRTRSYSGFAVESGTSAITSIQIRATSGTFDAGTYNLYGVK